MNLKFEKIEWELQNRECYSYLVDFWWIHCLNHLSERRIFLEHPCDLKNMSASNAQVLLMVGIFRYCMVLFVAETSDNSNGHVVLQRKNWLKNSCQRHISSYATYSQSKHSHTYMRAIQVYFMWDTFVLYMHVCHEINGNSGVLCVCYVLILVFFEYWMLLFVVNSCRIINSSLSPM